MMTITNRGNHWMQKLRAEVMRQPGDASTLRAYADFLLDVGLEKHSLLIQGIQAWRWMTPYEAVVPDRSPISREIRTRVFGFPGDRAFPAGVSTQGKVILEVCPQRWLSGGIGRPRRQYWKYCWRFPAWAGGSERWPVVVTGVQAQLHNAMQRAFKELLIHHRRKRWQRAGRFCICEFIRPPRPKSDPYFVE